MKFEDYLHDQFMRDDPIAFGMSNNDPGPFDDWCCNLDVDTMIAYAQSWHEAEDAKRFTS